MAWLVSYGLLVEPVFDVGWLGGVLLVAGFELADCFGVAEPSGDGGGWLGGDGEFVFPAFVSEPAFGVLHVLAVAVARPVVLDVLVHVVD